MNSSLGLLSMVLEQRIAVAVVEHQGQFLVGIRPEGAKLAGMWEFPGGKVEAGESLAAAAERECAEETGLSVQVVELLLDQRFTYPHGVVHLFFFACRLQMAVTQTDVTQMAVTQMAVTQTAGSRSAGSRAAESWPQPRHPFRWVSRRSLAELPFPAGNRELLRRLQSSPTSSEFDETASSAPR